MEQGTKCHPHKFLTTASFLLLGAIVLAHCVVSATSPSDNPIEHSLRKRGSWGMSAALGHFPSLRRLASLVPPQPLVLPYYNGPILSGKDNVTKLYVIFYREFTKLQRYTLRRFLCSLAPPRHRACQHSHGGQMVGDHRRLFGRVRRVRCMVAYP